MLSSSESNRWHYKNIEEYYPNEHEAILRVDVQWNKGNIICVITASSILISEHVKIDIS